MIANHRLKAYKYDPYDKQLTEELYDYDQMLAVRRAAVQKAANAGTFGIVLGTLGRQGSVKVTLFRLFSRSLLISADHVRS